MVRLIELFPEASLPKPHIATSDELFLKIRQRCGFKFKLLLLVLNRNLPLTKFDFGLPAVLIKFTETFKSIAVSLIPGRPSTWDQIYQNAVHDFLRSDHSRFWNAEPSLPAVFLTDSANFRGYMQHCYHEDCDDIRHLTPDMLEFLGQTVDSLVEVATNMTNEKCQMKKSGKVM